MKAPKVFRYGRKLDDFKAGETYAHPWDVTIDDGMIALFSACFLDATPTYASRAHAKALGFRDRPVHPLLLLNLGLSFSVHDVSEQAIAHLAYLDVRFPESCHVGDSVTASSKVLGVKPTSRGDKGVVHVRTLLQNEDGKIVCAFERKALVPAGKVEGRPEEPPYRSSQPNIEELPRLPSPLRSGHISMPTRQGGFGGFFEDYHVGDIFAHDVGKTIGESEHMQMTYLVRNSHPLHFDEHYSKENSFAKTRIVYGGLVLSWVLSLASRDTTGNAIWDMGLDQGAHPSGVMAGDTLYAASQVLSKEDRGNYGTVTFRVVGVKNVRSADLLAKGVDLFTPELGKKEGAVKEKVVEITRTVAMRKRP